VNAGAAFDRYGFLMIICGARGDEREAHAK
jgi:hypothetical protein